MTDAIAQLTFEQAMQRLEEVVGRLEKGNVPLAESITLYEEGAALRKHCEQKLNEAEEKVKLLVLDGEGQPTGAKTVEGL